MPLVEERPDDGPFLEVWMDIPEVGEPSLGYFEAEETDLIAAYQRFLVEEDEAEVLHLVRPIAGVDEWILHASDYGVGHYTAWIKLREF